MTDKPDLDAIEPTGEQALKWLIALCEATGKGTLWNVDARAVLRAIHQAEQAAIDETRNEIKAGLPSARETLAHIQNILAIGDNPDVEALIRDCLADFRLGVAQAARADERKKFAEQITSGMNEDELYAGSRLIHLIRALTNESGEPGEAA